jgi:hypothetical protein
MRGDKKPSFIAANIVNSQGDIKFHLIPTNWVKIGLIVFATLLIAAVVLGLMVVTNRFELDDLKYKMEVHEMETQNTNAQHPSNINR